MRIHTNTLKTSDLHAALAAVREQAPSVSLHILGDHGSRSHARSFDVALRGHGARHTRRPNTGVTGAGDEYAATFDDWGHFFAAIFEREPDAKIGSYNGVRDFRKQTKGEY